MAVALLDEVLAEKASQKLVTVDEDEPVQAAVERMCDANRGAVLVVKGDRLRGIFTERDLMRRVVGSRRDPLHTPVRDVMTTRLVVGKPEQSWRSALDRMVAANCRHLPIVEGTRVIGIVSRRELMALEIRVLADELDREDPSRLHI
jgi:CBS domain-containing protein